MQHSWKYMPDLQVMSAITTLQMYAIVQCNNCTVGKVTCSLWIWLSLASLSWSPPHGRWPRSRLGRGSMQLDLCYHWIIVYGLPVSLQLFLLLHKRIYEQDQPWTKTKTSTTTITMDTVCRQWTFSSMRFAESPMNLLNEGSSVFIFLFYFSLTTYEMGLMLMALPYKDLAQKFPANQPMCVSRLPVGYQTVWYWPNVHIRLLKISNVTFWSQQ